MPGGHLMRPGGQSPPDTPSAAPGRAAGSGWSRPDQAAGDYQVIWGRLAAELRAYYIGVEICGDRCPRYIATARRPGTHPHIMVTPDPDELRAELCRPAADGSWCFWRPWQQLIGSVDDLTFVSDRNATFLRSVEDAT
jgi:hypothetical protein